MIMKLFKYVTALAMTLVTMGSASAFPVKFQWNVPGSVEIMYGSYIDGEIVGPDSESATDCTYEAAQSGWMYLVAKEGYKIESAEIDGSAVNPSMYGGKIYVGKYVTSATEMKAELTPIQPDASIEVNVENGADWIQMMYNYGATVGLKNGDNVVKYDSSLVTSINFLPVNGVADFNKITLNGEPMVSINQWHNQYIVTSPKQGDKVVIRVFEDEEPVLYDCTVSITLPDGLEDCIYSIRNWTTNDWETPVDGKFVVKSDTDIQVNFIEGDYTYTKFILNGEDVTSTYKNGSLKFKVTEDTSLDVEGYPTHYDDVMFTAYVMNPEGVTLFCGQYMGNPADLSEGEEPAEDIVIPATDSMPEIIMPANDTRKYQIPVSSRRPYIYVNPKEGWYIDAVMGISEGEMSVISNITSDTPEFYVVARKLDAKYPVNFNVKGDAANLRLTASILKSNLWGNPTNTFTLTEGEQEVEVIPDYDLPLSLRSTADVKNFGVFLDGAPLSADDNNTYTITPYYPVDDEALKAISTVTVQADGSVAATSRIKVEFQDDEKAEVSYSAVQHALNLGGTTLLAGTEIYIRPANIDITIVMNGEVINGLDGDDHFVNGLNEAGECIIAAPTGAVNIVISKGCGIVGIDQIAAAPVRSGIYTIDGVKLDSYITDPANLPKGIYIINGKKVAIK